MVLLLGFFSGDVLAMELEVRVFSNRKIHQASFTVVQGYYHLKAGEHEKTLSRFQQLSLKAEGSRVVVIRNGKRLFSAQRLRFRGAHEQNIFRLIPSGVRERDYDDGLDVTANGSHLIFINVVDLEHYVAGVVLSEVGRIEVPEYYKIQDIISRTYALQNLRKHAHEGYNLCDAEHCQVYVSRCNLPVINESISITRGDVIVDSSGQLITAAFHSNSGGHTINSEDVWSGALPYLRGISDTFSLAMSKAYWTDTIPVAEWLAYFSRKHGIHRNDSVDYKLTHFVQPPRQTHILPGVHLKQVRADWKLRSTFFSVRPEGRNVILEGRGWGHGTGLSQQGAMRMIELGHDYEEVIRHYYQGVRITPLDSLGTFPE